MLTLMNLMDEINALCAKARKIDEKTNEITNEIDRIRNCYKEFEQNANKCQTFIDILFLNRLNEKISDLANERIKQIEEYQKVKTRIVELRKQFTKIWTGGNEYVD